MIVTCSACTTRYHIEPAALPQAGRTVRCANCGHRWQVRPPADAPLPLERPPMPLERPAPAMAAAAPSRRSSSSGQTPTRRSASLLGWGAGVAMALVLASAILGRNEIVAVFPASASLYQKLGLPLAFDLGLQLEKVSSQRLAERDL